MRQWKIWTIAIVMGLSFLGLLLLQLSYIEDMVKMKREQFDESVGRSLSAAAKQLEMDETASYLEQDVRETEGKAYQSDSAVVRNLGSTIQHSHQFSVSAVDGTVYSSFQLQTITTMPKSVAAKRAGLRQDQDHIADATRAMRDIIRGRYVYQKALLDEVVYRILYTASDRPLQERINFKMLDQDIRAELLSNGISLPYHFRVTTADGREVHRCQDYTDEGSQYLYSTTLFNSDPAAKMGRVTINFPDIDKYIFSSVRFMFPAIAFTVVLLITFVFTIVIIFRQKRYSELKTDFVNNMTHELKTPIASISLAAQMLNDDTVKKSEQMTRHLSGVIADETKRLRFLVEKVLQMSMFERKKATMKLKETDINELVENAAHSFQLRVEHTKGKIYTQIEALDSTIYVDEVHFQNVVYNLMDNAVKYRQPDKPLDIYLRTWNEGSKVCLSIRDTGMGIKKENLKKIFERFYRVHTGNRHDAKGFGLGLAYVKNVIDLLGATIHVDSEIGQGTTFTIRI